MITNTLCIDIDLREERQELENDIKYNLKISKELLKNKTLKLHFPNTNSNLFDEETSINLNKYTSFVKLDQAIAKRLQNTKIIDKYVKMKDPKHSLKLAIEFQKKRYNIWGVLNEHNYYVYWLESFTSFSSLSGYNSQIEDNIPILIEMDGKGEFLNLVPFLENENVEPIFWSKIHKFILPIVELLTCEIVPKKRLDFKSLSNFDATVIAKEIELKDNDIIDYEITNEISLDEEKDEIKEANPMIQNNNNNNLSFDLEIGK
jgi:hypothetical protein